MKHRGMFGEIRRLSLIPASSYFFRRIFCDKISFKAHNLCEINFVAFTKRNYVSYVIIGHPVRTIFAFFTNKLFLLLAYLDRPTDK